MTQPIQYRGNSNFFMLQFQMMDLNISLLKIQIGTFKWRSKQALKIYKYKIQKNIKFTNWGHGAAMKSFLEGAIIHRVKNIPKKKLTNFAGVRWPPGPPGFIPDPQYILLVYFQNFFSMNELISEITKIVPFTRQPTRIPTITPCC